LVCFHQTKTLVMKKMLGFFLFLAVLIYSCSVVPVTGRRQLSLLPESEMISMGLTSYKAFMDTMKVSANTIKTAIVTEVGGKIVSAVTTYLATNNLQSRLDGYEWEFSLIQDDSTANAFCLPGGKIVVKMVWQLLLVMKLLTLLPVMVMKG
jgi:predicted Zn-dependent protease